MRDTRLLATVPAPLRLGSRTSATRSLRLSIDDVPGSELSVRLEEFFLPLGVRYDATRLGDQPVEIDLKLQGIPGLQIFSGRMQGARYRRMRESNDPEEDVGLMLNAIGAQHIAQLGREVVLDDGDATLVSLTEPLDAAHRPPAAMRALRVPRALLTPLLADGQDGFLRRIPHGTPALRLLSGYLDLAWQEQTLADQELQPLLVSHFHDLIAVTIGATRDAAAAAQGRGLRAARLAAIKQDIARHLGGADLSVSAIADRHGCTERLVQRLFETDGTTFTHYVLAQRVARARRMLIDPRRDGEKISTLAYDCGFGDVSYFNRVFRRAYGAAPSDIRAQAREAARVGFVPDGS